MTDWAMLPGRSCWNGQRISCVFLLLNDGTLTEEDKTPAGAQPVQTSGRIDRRAPKETEDAQRQLQSIKEELEELAAYGPSMERAVAALKKEVEFETYASGMGEEDLSEDASGKVSVAYLVGFLPAEDLGRLQKMARKTPGGFWRKILRKRTMRRRSCATINLSALFIL